MMSTRRSRKQVLKAAREQPKDHKENDQPSQKQQQQPTSGTTTTTTTTTSSAKGAASSNSLVREFLETWLQTKQNMRSSKEALTDEEMFEEISRRLIDAGYSVSSKLVRNKIASFIGKYQYVKSCEREGKKIEWSNYDIVNKIFDLDNQPKDSEFVVIPRQNIKSEDELNISDDNITIKEEQAELIEIPDDTIAASQSRTEPRMKSEENERENDDESESSEDDLDDDLEFENPLDNIPLKLPNGTTVELERTSMDPPSAKKAKIDLKSGLPPLPQLRTVPQFPISPKIPAAALTAQPRTIPGLKKDEFLIPTVNNATGQQQFLVVKRLEQTNGPTPAPPLPSVTPPPLLKTVPTIVSPLVSPVAGNSLPKSISAKSSSSSALPNPRWFSESTILNAANKRPPKDKDLSPVAQSKSAEGTTSGKKSASDGDAILARLAELQERLVQQEESRQTLERQRLEQEREFQQEMIELFREIKDKLCDKS